MQKPVQFEHGIVLSIGQHVRVDPAPHSFGTLVVCCVENEQGAHITTKEDLLRGLNQDLNFELEAAVRYLYHSAVATSLLGHELREFLKTEIPRELDHAVFLTDKIVAIGGEPDLHVSMPRKIRNAKEMLEENIAAGTQSRGQLH